MSISDQQLAELREAASRAASNAWCPYSGFPVGAAVLAEDGQVFVGCNVENSSTGLTICAERHAVANAVVNGCRDFRAVVVYTPTDVPTTPCGACRQVMSEFSPDAEIVCICDGPEVLKLPLNHLLPHRFGAHNLDSESTA